MNIDLQKYCQEGEIAYVRQYLNAPFRQKEGLIATSGHILVCIPDDGRELHRADIPAVPEKISAAISGWLAEQHTFVPFHKGACGERDCPACKGSGKRLVIEDDDSETMETCESCIGQGRALEIGHAVVAMKYANMLAELSNVQVTHRLPQDMIHFAFDGGRGCVMPMRSA